MRLFLPRNWIVSNLLSGGRSIFNIEFSRFNSQFPKTAPIIDKITHGNMGTKSTDVIFDDEKPIQKSNGLSKILLFSQMAVIIVIGISNIIVDVCNLNKNGKNRLVRVM